MMTAILTATSGLLALAALVQTARLRALREHLAETAVDDAWADALDMMTADDGGEEEQR